MKSALRHLAWTLPVLALLAGCNGGESAKPEPHAVATYAPATWKDLPAVSDEDLLAGFYAWRNGCEKLKRDAVWAATCEAAGSATASAAQVRTFLEQNLQVYGLRSAENNANGLITGYYEPVYPGSLNQSATNHVAVYGIPDDMIVVDLASVYPELKGKRLRGRLEGRVLKPYDLGYADQNGHPYRPIGRWLVEQGQLKKEEVSMGAIHAWAQANPQRVPELLASNPSYVFFSTRPDSNEGPRGSLNVPLTAGYSVAIDRKVIPLGSLLWLSTTRPDGTPVVRPVGAQDTGGAITGEVRADLFWGTGPEAGELAGNMKQQGQIWMLWPKGQPLPEVPKVP